MNERVMGVYIYLLVDLGVLYLLLCRESLNCSHGEKGAFIYSLNQVD